MILTQPVILGVFNAMWIQRWVYLGFAQPQTTFAVGPNIDAVSFLFHTPIYSLGTQPIWRVTGKTRTRWCKTCIPM